MSSRIPHPDVELELQRLAFDDQAHGETPPRVEDGQVYGGQISLAAPSAVSPTPLTPGVWLRWPNPVVCLTTVLVKMSVNAGTVRVHYTLGAGRGSVDFFLDFAVTAAELGVWKLLPGYQFAARELRVRVQVLAAGGSLESFVSAAAFERAPA